VTLGEIRSAHTGKTNVLYLFSAMKMSSGARHFIPVKEAQRRPSTTTVERVPKPGHGDTKK